VRAPTRRSSVTHAVWVASALHFALVVHHSYVSYTNAWDLYWVHLGINRFLHGRDPYDVYMFVNPPSAGLLLAPAGAASWATVKLGFLIVSAVLLFATVSIAMRAAGWRWASVAGALLLVVVAEMPAVRATLGLGNVNSLVLFCQAVALAAMVEGRWNIAGGALGVSLAVKPILGSLLILPILARRWRSVALAALVPAALVGVAVAYNSRSAHFFTERIDFLLQGNAEVLELGNVAIVGAFRNLSLPPAAAQLVRAVTLVAAVSFALFRWRVSEPASADDSALRLRVLETAGFLVLGTILCFSFSWLYYGVYLIPLLATFGHDRSLLRHPLAVIGLVLLVSSVGVPGQTDRVVLSSFQKIRPTISWMLILVGMGAALVTACVRERSPRAAA
jgi:arabinofuranan 3-O-arabinosyltransferase